MSETAFLEHVQVRTDLESTDAAREATEATLRTLGERVGRGEAEDIAEGFPPDFRAWLLESRRDAQEYSLDEFLDEIADREGVSREEAHRHAQAVFDAIEEMHPESEILRMRTQLPESYDTLL